MRTIERPARRPRRLAVVALAALALAGAVGCSGEVEYGADARRHYVEGCEADVVDEPLFERAGVKRSAVQDYCRCAYDGFADDVPIEDFRPYADGQRPAQDELGAAMLEVIDGCITQTLGGT